MVMSARDWLCIYFYFLRVTFEYLSLFSAVTFFVPVTSLKSTPILLIKLFTCQFFVLPKVVNYFNMEKLYFLHHKFYLKHFSSFLYTLKSIELLLANFKVNPLGLCQSGCETFSHAMLYSL